MIKNIIILILLFVSQLAISQETHKYLRSGNKLYNAGKYKEAEIDYRKSYENNKEYYKALFNLGDALYKQNNYQESANVFSLLSQNNKLDHSTKSKIYHNLGNNLLKERKYEESINAYKNALKLNPKDAETKYNLAFAQKKLIEQQQQQQQQDKENKENKDNKNKKEQQKQEEKKEENKEQQQQQQQKNEISKEDAEKMLNALLNQEKNLQDKLKKDSVNIVRSGILKDW